jgi:FKBP-type peptidyl-prolyl cis-trans isomerase FklB
MKLTKIVLGAVLALATMASCNKFQGSSKLKNDVDSVSYCIGISVGNSLKDADLPNFNSAAFAKAIDEVLAKQKTKLDPQAANMYLNQYFQKLQEKRSAVSLKEGEEFLKKNKERKEVKTTASGLQYEVIKEGNGVTPKADDMVTVHYTGKLINDTIFDSSYKRGQPAQFKVNQVIPGWTEALQLMKVGSKYKLYIPSSLGYGERPDPRSKIKPNSVLIFEVELLAAEAPKPEPAAAKKK